MKFRKKPVVIDAMQFDGKWPPVADWLELLASGGLAFQPGMEPPMTMADDGASILIPTLEGTMRADIGDWIIRGIAGEFYPCKPDIFSDSYEEAER